MFAQRTSRILIAAAVVVCTVALMLGMASPSPGAATPGHYRVKSGDTLWSIASTHYSGGDTRDGVYKIRSANHLSDATITIGQRLVLP
jgi:LysM repeat protein